MSVIQIHSTQAKTSMPFEITPTKASPPPMTPLIAATDERATHAVRAPIGGGRLKSRLLLAAGSAELQQHTQHAQRVEPSSFGYCHAFMNSVT